MTMNSRFAHRLLAVAVLSASIIGVVDWALAANSFFNASGTPAQGSALSSAAMRTEFANIGAGFDKMPSLTANTAIVVNSSGTALTNTVGSLALAGNFTTTGAFNTTLVQQADISITLPLTADTLLGRATTDTLTNKSISGSTNTITNIGNAALTNSSITIGSSAVSLGGTLSTINGNLTFGGANAYGTPASITLTNATGLVASTGTTATGTPSSSTFLRGDNTWATPSGAGNVNGPGSAVTGNLASFNGTSGTIIQDSGVASSSVVTLTGSQTLTNKTLTAPTMTAPVLGTPASGTLTNTTGFPAASLAGLGTGVATFLATPSSANLLSALTTKTGTGSAVFGTAPTISAPVISGHATIEGVTPTGATGSGNLAFSASPTFSGTVTAASISATNAATTGTLDAGTNFTVAGIAAIHTTLGGWSSNANFEVLSVNPGPASAVSGYTGASTGNAFLGRVDNTSGAFAGWNYNGTYVGSITTNGTTTSYNTSSDQRLKNNITDAAAAGTIIDGLRVRQWDWKSNGTHEAFGFVAQEEVSAAPFAVRVGDNDPVTITTQWSRDDSKLVPLLVKEIQSLRARVAALEAR